MPHTQDTNPAALFQDLYQREGSSLLRYLINVPPYITPTEKPLWSALQKIAAATDDRVHSFERLFENAIKSINLPPLHFPTRFASLNYVSLTYLLPELLAEKKSLIAAYEQAAALSDNLHYFTDTFTAHQQELALLESFHPAKTK